MYLMGNSSKRTAVEVKNIDLALQCLKVRLTGATYQQVAAAVPGVTGKGSAHRLVHQAIADRIKDLAEPADAVRAMELARLDSMMMGLWTKASRGDVPAVQSVLRIMERRAAYEGLDAPTKQNVTGEIDLTMARMSDAADAVRRKLAGGK